MQRPSAYVSYICQKLTTLETKTEKNMNIFFKLMKSIIFQDVVANINSSTQESEAGELFESEVSLGYKMSTVPARAKRHSYIDNSPPKKNNIV